MTVGDPYRPDYRGPSGVASDHRDHLVVDVKMACLYP